MKNAPQSLVASERVLSLLSRLHAASEAQENTFSQKLFYLSRIIDYYFRGELWTAASDDHMRDKFVSLEPDKCQLVYLIARSIGARNIVEAGTSFGVSTIYLALAVGQNVEVENAKLPAGAPRVHGKVIATEKEPTKAERARKHWSEAGEEVEPWIELRVGDLKETLKVDEGMPETVDLLLLDIWTPLALPALEIIKPRLRPGSVVIADNTTMAKSLYKEFLDYIHNPANGFKSLTIPYTGGLEMVVYLP